MARDVLIERKVYPQGEIIFKEGTLGHTAYIVQTGSVDIVRGLEGKEQVLLGTVGVGGIFGEMAMIDDHPRMATARAAEPTTVIIITQQMFLNKLNKADPFIRGLMNIMADTIRSLGKKAHNEPEK